MDEISCTQKTIAALHDCSDRMLFDCKAQDKLILAQAIETLSRSLEILERIKEEGAE